ncbi:MAG: diguanylate cyclase, partial [Candidatus Electrothrix sp. AUS1_2]|nr:diguanylate cyclase [Candidatus Electrothrix sp. AUS1_2]
VSGVLIVEMYDEDHTVTASLGVAIYPEHGQTVQEVIKAADCALYEAKNKGRNRVVLAGKSVPNSRTDMSEDED